MRDAARVFASRDNGATWEQLATNNSIRTSPALPTTPNSELPTYLTTSRDAYPVAPNQAIQELFDVGDAGAPDTWRQARVDLADFAGEPNLKLRFDFSTAAAMTPDFSMPGDIQGVGHFDRRRMQNNNHEGFYIDDIIIGFAERAR